MVEFADAAKQADWRRIGQAAKKAQSEPTGTVIADPLAELPEATPARKPLTLALGISAVCAVLVVVGIVVFHKPPPPPPPTDAYISVTTDPPGALVSVDGGISQPTDPSGLLNLPVSPTKQHQLKVTMEGYEPYNENVLVAAGQNLPDNITLIKLPTKNSGSLVMQGNLPTFKVTVDGISHGIQKKDGSLTLEAKQKPYIIQYSNEDGDTTPKHPVLITAGKSVTDPFTLKPPSPKVAPAAIGTLFVQTTPNAFVSVDGKPKGNAGPDGTLTVPSLTLADPHTVEISLTNHLTASNLPVKVMGGQFAPLNQTLKENPPPPPAITTGSLSITTTALAQVSLSGPNGQYKDTANSSGGLVLPNIKPGTYSLEVKEDGYVSGHLDDITISAGVQTPSYLTLNPTPIVEHNPQPPPDDNHATDKEGIKAAILSLQGAYKAKNLGKIPPAWLNKGKLKELFDESTMPPQIQENNCSEPDFKGNTATQKCTENVKFFNDDKTGSTVHVTLTFTKTGNSWVLVNKTTP